VIEDNYVSYDELFSPEGTRISYHWHKFAHEIWQSYDQSTGILLVRFEKEDKDEPGATYTFINADYHNADGSLKEHRLFSYYKMVATLADEQTGIEYVQHWRMRNTSAPVETRLEPENFKLEKVVFARLDGKSDVSVIMDDKGEYVRIVRFADRIEKDGPLDHTRELTFDADGRLIKDVLRLKSKEISITEYGSDGRIGHGVDSRYLQPVPYTVPPKVPDDPVYDEGR
ncbi:MAG: hypothetical protein K8F91_19090, partial [Candidatus Obscuribacterales bacterium]|nr:hypothetical protein [Candidatus Obscuribacterales bacterium]